MSNWYEQWMEQNKAFFTAAQQHFNSDLNKKMFTHPEENLDQVNEWLDALKKEWDVHTQHNEQLAYQAYWQMMAKMCSEATDIMIGEWMKRARENNPLRNSKELYELWLNSCHEVYQKTIHSDAYQKNYADFIKGATDFWKATLAKQG